MNAFIKHCLTVPEPKLQFPDLNSLHPNYNIFTIPTPSPTTTEDWINWREDENEANVNLAASTPHPWSTMKPQVIYENYDTKYNVYDNDPDPKDPPVEHHFPNRVTEATAPSTILVR